MTSFSFTEAPADIEVRRHAASSPWTYSLLDARQREIAARVRAGGPGALLLSEVAPVITVGRRAPSTDLLFPRQYFEDAGVEICATDRGGLATYHGPGQWVLFVVDSLERLTGDPRGVRKSVQGLLEVGLQVARRDDASAEIREGAQTGVWTPRGKIGAVGVHIERGVLLHGLSVNGFRTEKSFLGIKPCGLDLPVDFLLESQQGFDRLGERILEAAIARFYKEQAL